MAGVVDTTHLTIPAMDRIQSIMIITVMEEEQLPAAAELEGLLKQEEVNLLFQQTEGLYRKVVKLLPEEQPKPTTPVLPTNQLLLIPAFSQKIEELAITVA